MVSNFLGGCLHKSPAAVGGEVARNQALKISRLFHEKIKTMVEIKLYQQQNGDTCFIIVILAIIHCKMYLLSIKNCQLQNFLVIVFVENVKSELIIMVNLHI